MDRRTHESPMDFQYDNQTGPMDARSPFAQLSRNVQRPLGDEASSRKRPLHQAFGSPSKPVFPGLREPASSQTHLFSSTTANPVSSSPTKPTPFSRSSYSLFATPRKLDNDLASSGGETPKSPEHAGTDTDATPDNSLNFRSAAVKFSNNTATAPSFTAGDKPVSPVKEKRRDSWFRRLLPSPGRGEVARGGTYTDKAVKRVRKQRKNRALTRVRRDSISDSEASDVVMASSPRKTSSGGGRGQGDENDTKQDDGRKGPHWMYTFFDFLSTHPTLPHILSWYVQLALNAFLFTLFGYVVWTFWSAIRSDVDMKSEEAVKALMTEMEDCARNYLTNRCARDSRMPALEALCNNWDKCMNRDPNVGRAKVSAHTFAEIFNSFLEPISYKTMIFTIILIFGFITLGNLPFKMARHQAEQAAANHHHYYGNNMPPPPTPQRQFSNPIEQAPYWTPHHINQQQALEPAPSGDFGGIDGQGSPVRRLQFR